MNEITPGICAELQDDGTVRVTFQASGVFRFPSAGDGPLRSSSHQGQDAIANLLVALESAMDWHKSEDKALSKSAPSTQSACLRLQHREQIEALSGAISAASSEKVEPVVITRALDPLTSGTFNQPTPNPEAPFKCILCGAEKPCEPCSDIENWADQDSLNSNPILATKVAIVPHGMVLVPRDVLERVTPGFEDWMLSHDQKGRAWLASTQIQMGDIKVVHDILNGAGSANRGDAQ